MPRPPAAFAGRLLRWFDQHGRHDLPWQHPREPYRVWLAEIMLQQTQVATVIPYFRRFLARFPTLETLAAAPVDDVLALWAGLGYYARARNLHRCAQRLVAEHGGTFPRDLETLTELPGIGRSTAGAILTQAFGERYAILDGNVRRVLARHAAVAGWSGAPAVQKKLWGLSEQHLPRTRLADYTQALMDLGATVCTARQPRCGECPVRTDCRAHSTGTVARYPVPKPRRERPLRQRWLLLIENDVGGFLCERRPPRGIWGGLWCPPLQDTETDWRAYCRTHYKLRAATVESLKPVHHGFTHFDLDLHPVRLRVRTTAVKSQEENPALAWITLEDAQTRHGLPAPVSKLLHSITRPTP